ncbi:MAG: GspE/PulE family protein [Candidatus Methylacidiphilales bacterium]|nr:ATPase, T2SS/T4P/T4SS family [Candidatus Methylacidiphilales bacterium]
MNPNLVLSLLQDSQYIDDNQFADLLEESTRSGKTIAQLTSDYGIIDTPKLYEIIAQHLGTYVIDLQQIHFSPQVLTLMPAAAARSKQSIPIAWEDNVLHVAVSDPLDPQVIDALQFASQKEVQVVVADPSVIQDFVERFYGSAAGEAEALLDKLAGDAANTVSDSGEINLDEANSAPIIQYVNSIVAQAIKAGASDIHFEPFEHDFRIRYRVDGALYEMKTPPRKLATAITSRIKVMASLNIAERRIPQDGRIQTSMAGRPVDLRVSTLPTQFGESVVLRVLDRSMQRLDLDALKMPPKIHAYICETIEKPNGIFIVTGPTGSGKTTTLYSCLNRINTEDSKLLTAEDPVEYEIEGVLQVPVNESIGLSFARVLRAFLRQDPDRIMIGETRDLETAQIAIQASLTGHLVFTTLHTNDAPGAVARLIDMGVEPFLIAATLEGVLGQRLVRKICQNCKTPYEPSEEILEQIGLSAHEVGDKIFYYGSGCEFCNNTGYKGRKGIYELLDVNEPIRELITNRSPSIVIRQKAIELGMTTLRSDGLRSIFDGDTSIEEVLKYT